MSDSYPQVEVASRVQWRAWLEDNAADVRGIWLVTWKKAAGDRHLPYDHIVREALCFGWVDSQARSLDDARSQRLVTPRQRGSSWSAANKLRIEELEASGLMTAAGRAAVESAKADGSWSALDTVEALEEPADLRAALDAEPAARREWDGFPPSTRRAILEWIGAAKRDATRARRVAETTEKAAVGIRANQWRQPGG